MTESFTEEQISNARLNAKELHNIYSDMPFETITSKLGGNFQTFRAWCYGNSDFYNNKLALIAELFNVTLEELITR